MKRIMMISFMLSLVLLFTACSKNEKDNITPARSGDTMEKEEMSTEDKMDNEADMEKEEMSTEDKMNKQDDMGDKNSSETMEKDTMDDNAMMNEGEMAPDFIFKTLDGDTASLADFKGEKLYVKFWASWCPICIGGLEEIDTLSAEAEGFKVITVVTPNFRGEKSEEEFKAWYDSMKTPDMTVLLDVDGTFAKDFGVRAYPTSAYIGSDSTLIKVAPGHVANEKIVETIGTFK